MPPARFIATVLALLPCVSLASAAGIPGHAGALRGAALPGLPGPGGKVSFGILKAAKPRPKLLPALAGLRGTRVPAAMAVRAPVVAAPVSAFGFLAPPVAARAPAPAVRPFVAAARNVSLDSSLGQTQQPTVSTNSAGQSDYAITGTMGRQVGGNLFFSFSSFNLATQESATFSGPFPLSTPVRNILARVTGGISVLDGTLSTSAISGANFFLLNPAGAIFGPNARLDVGGSFVVSTGDYTKLADGALFQSAPGAADEGLSAAPVAAFGFTNSAPGGVLFAGSGLAVPGGTGLQIVAGTITLRSGVNAAGAGTAAALLAPSGALGLFSASSAGEVPFLAAAPATAFARATAKSGGAISLSNLSLVAIDGPGGGAMALYGGKVSLDDSLLTTANTGAAAGGTIFLHARTLSLLDGAIIGSTTLSTGTAGDMHLFANSVKIAGAQIEMDTRGAGRAGHLQMAVAGTLAVQAAGSINGTTFASGKGSTLSISAGSLTIDGSAAPTLFTGIGVAANPAATGQAGDIAVHVAGALTMRGHGMISANTQSAGAGGNILVAAGSLAIDGAATPRALTGIASNAVAGTGHAGAVTVAVAGALTLRDGAEITASTFSAGAAGNLHVTAGSLEIDGTHAPKHPTGIEDDSNQGATGKAGALTVEVAGALTIRGGGDISASTAASGAGGNLLVRAGALTIDGSAASARFTGLAAESGLAGKSGRIASGHAGNLTVEVAGALTLRGGGEINVSTAGFGDAGTLTVEAGSLLLDGAGIGFPRTGIINVANTGSFGDAGAVRVTVGGALAIRDGGEIVASTFAAGQGGSLLVSAGSLALDGSAAPGEFTGITASSNPGATGDAGSLTVQVADALTLRGRAEISASTFSSGAGGDLLVTAGSLDIDGAATPGIFTGIDAGSTGRGAAGNLTVDVAGTLSLRGSGEISVTTFSSGQGGVLSIDSASLTIDGTETASNRRAGRTGIFAASAAPSGGGAGGDITITSGEVLLRAGGIEASSDSAARSGSVTLEAAGLRLTDFSVISSANAGSGRAGSVTIRTAGALAMSGASVISTSALLGDAGDIQLRAGSRIDLQSLSTIASSAGQNGGNITLTAPDLVNLRDSAIVATAGTRRTATGAGGQGGNITIDPTFIVLDRSLISANAAAGQGGNILLDSQFFLNSESAITATGATAGTIVITSPELDLTNGLLPLSGSLIDASSQLREQCAQRLGQDFSSFLVLGRGGVEVSPEDPQASGAGDSGKRGKKPKAQAR